MYNKNRFHCCKNFCCRPCDPTWLNYANCNKTKLFGELREPGITKGLIQSLRDKIINLQGESANFKFGKRPLKKKQKDYYCLMLRKINTLDKKLQYLQDLFVSHLNSPTKKSFDIEDHEHSCDYLNFCDSVQSLINLANKLKEDVCDKNEINFNDESRFHLCKRIHLLESELRELSVYLNNLQKCNNKMNNSKVQSNHDQKLLVLNQEIKQCPPSNKQKSIKQSKRGNQDCQYTRKLCMNTGNSQYERKYNNYGSNKRYLINNVDIFENENQKTNRPNINYQNVGGYSINDSIYPCNTSHINGGKKKQIEQNLGTRMSDYSLFSNSSCSICQNKYYNSNCIGLPNECSERYSRIRILNDYINHIDAINSHLKSSKTVNGSTKVNCDDVWTSNRESLRKTKKYRRNKQKNPTRNGHTWVIRAFSESPGRKSLKSVTDVRSRHYVDKDRSISPVQVRYSGKKNNEKTVRNIFYYELPPENISSDSDNSNERLWKYDNQHNLTNNKSKRGKNIYSAEKNNNHQSANTCNILNSRPRPISCGKFLQQKYSNSPLKNNFSCDENSSDISRLESENSVNLDNLSIEANVSNFNKYKQNTNTYPLSKHYHISFHKQDESKNTSEKKGNEQKHFIGPYKIYYDGKLINKSPNKIKHNSSNKKGVYTNSFKNRFNKIKNNFEINESESYESVCDGEKRCGGVFSHCQIYSCNDPKCKAGSDPAETVIFLNDDSSFDDESLMQIVQIINDLKADNYDECTVRKKQIPIKNRDRSPKAKKVGKIIVKKQVLKSPDNKQKMGNQVSDRNEEAEYVVRKEQTKQVVGTNMGRDLTENEYTIHHSKVKPDQSEYETKNYFFSDRQLDRIVHIVPTKLENDNMFSSSAARGNEQSSISTQLKHGNNKNINIDRQEFDKDTSMFTSKIKDNSTVETMNEPTIEHRFSQTKDREETSKRNKQGNLRVAEIKKQLKEKSLISSVGKEYSQELQNVSSKNENIIKSEENKQIIHSSLNKYDEKNVKTIENKKQFGLHSELINEIPSKLQTPNCNELQGKTSLKKALPSKKHNNAINNKTLKTAIGRDIKLENMSYNLSRDPNLLESIKENGEKEERTIVLEENSTSKNGDQFHQNQFNILPVTQTEKYETDNSNLKGEEVLILKKEISENSNQSIGNENYQLLQEVWYKPVLSKKYITSKKKSEPKYSSLKKAHYLKDNKLKSNSRLGYKKLDISNHAFKTNSVTVQHCKICPKNVITKKSKNFSSGRRNSKPFKRRFPANYNKQNSSKNTHYFNYEISNPSIISGSQIESAFQTKFINNVNLRMTSESSFSVLNWEKIANKLKDENAYTYTNY